MNLMKVIALFAYAIGLVLSILSLTMTTRLVLSEGYFVASVIIMALDVIVSIWSFRGLLTIFGELQSTPTKRPQNPKE